MTGRADCSASAARGSSCVSASSPRKRGCRLSASRSGGGLPAGSWWPSLITRARSTR